MDFHQLNCFIAAAQYLNFTKAAKSLYLTQSSVSHNIAELEKELGAKLFYRTKSSVSLTVVGETLLSAALKLDSNMRSAINLIKMTTQGTTGELTVGYVFEPIAEHSIDSFRRFGEKYPDINVRYRTYNSVDMSRRIVNNELDIGFSRFVTLLEHKRLEWKHLYSDPLYAVVSVDHPMAGADKLTIEQIAEETIVLMNRQENPGMFDMVHHMFLAAGFSPIINDSTNDLYTSIMMARLGLGIVILPGQFKIYKTPDINYIPLDDENAFHDIGVAWNKSNDNPALKLFLEELFPETPEAVDEPPGAEPSEGQQP